MRRAAFVATADVAVATGPALAVAGAIDAPSASNNAKARIRASVGGEHSDAPDRFDCRYQAGEPVSRARHPDPAKAATADAEFRGQASTPHRNAISVHASDVHGAQLRGTYTSRDPSQRRPLRVARPMRAGGGVEPFREGPTLQPDVRSLCRETLGAARGVAALTAAATPAHNAHPTLAQPTPTVRRA